MHDLSLLQRFFIVTLVASLFVILFGYSDQTPNLMVAEGFVALMCGRHLSKREGDEYFQKLGAVTFNALVILVLAFSLPLEARSLAGSVALFSGGGLIVISPVEVAHEQCL